MLFALSRSHADMLIRTRDAGGASVFDPPVSFWQTGAHGDTAPAPSGLSFSTKDGFQPWSDPVADAAEVFAWRKGHWNNW
jgi:hypothetical protein